MKFFIDTANLAQIKEAHELGILDGVTTNPSLMFKEGIYPQPQPYSKGSRAGSPCVCTCPLDSILGLLEHPLTDIGLAKFIEDAKKMQRAEKSVPV